MKTHNRWLEHLDLIFYNNSFISFRLEQYFKKEMPELRDYKKFSLSLILTEKVIDEKKFIDAKNPQSHWVNIFYQVKETISVTFSVMSNE